MEVVPLLLEGAPAESRFPEVGVAERAVEPADRVVELVAEGEGARVAEAEVVEVVVIHQVAEAAGLIHRVPR